MTKIAYLFPGQGSQFIGMGQDLYNEYDEVKNIFDTAAEKMGFDIRSICFSGPEEKLKQTRYAQAAIFVTSIACLKVFESKILPHLEQSPIAAAGLSLGEATALVATGVMSLEDGMVFVRDRGLYMDEASLESPGTMAAVMNLDLEIVEKISQEAGCEVGNLNCPGQVVISGPTKAVQKAVEKCKESGAKRCIPLDVSGAFHSKCMESACSKINTALTDIRMSEPKFTMISNLTAQSEVDPARIKTNLVNQMKNRTLWEASMRYLIDQGVGQFYELGPGKVLKGLMRKIDPTVVVTSLGSVEEFKMLEENHATSG